MSAGSRFRKSKIWWPPGSSPVEKELHDTGVCGGTGGVSGEKPPRAASADRLGRRPAAIIVVTTPASTPSNASTTTREGGDESSAALASAAAKKCTDSV